MFHTFPTPMAPPSECLFLPNPTSETSLSDHETQSTNLHQAFWPAKYTNLLSSHAVASSPLGMGRSTGDFRSSKALFTARSSPGVSVVTSAP